MKLFKIILTSLALFCVVFAWSKPRCQPLYIFGVSASFNDSIVYITDIQILDSAWVDDKTGFLLQRNEYSNQLRSYFTSKGQLNRTCLVCFSDNQKKISKKYEKMKRRYQNDGKRQKNFDYRELDEEDFKFVCVVQEAYEEEANMDKKARKKADKARKKADKARKKIEKGELKNKKTSPEETPYMPPRR